MSERAHTRTLAISPALVFLLEAHCLIQSVGCPIIYAATNLGLAHSTFLHETQTVGQKCPSEPFALIVIVCANWLKQPNAVY